ncbi:MAG TPA: endonuclease/exonuclease/phosphatase family protein [Bacteroidales bacterium]|nr:endonuclease/exonuclease/phosphatase family protein [Bacteroidales bacterium]
MKTILSGMLLIFLLTDISAQSIDVATYNLRYKNNNDSLDLWENRYPVIASLIKYNNFEIFGTQEGLNSQLKDLKSALPEYSYIGVGRTDGKEDGEYAAIFYKTAQFKLLEQGTFWLSTVTDKPNVGWDAALPRICTWGKFTEKSSGLTFFMFNVHFDHKGVQARQESAKLILSKMKEMAGKTPAILTGDFNVDETNESYALLHNSGVLKDAYEIAEIKFAPNGTFNSFNVNSKPVGRIDHIFLTSGFEVQRYGILTNTYNGRYPSDHFPVLVKLKYHK